jgi:Lrp/AsnC family transcriptional regulator, leucine-responsive regulatory protein
MRAMPLRTKIARLDATDVKLLELLQDDARLSNAELARRVGLSRPAVRERISLLEQSGVIRGYRAEVDATALGWNLEAFIHVRVRDGLYEQAITRLLKHPEVVECHRVASATTVVLRVRAVSTTHLQQLIFSITPHGDTETLIVLSSALKSRTLYPPATRSSNQ